MGVSLVVGITDRKWFDMLRHRPNLEEVNFWLPSGRNFRALRKGELFLFKLHSPDNVIVGGGIFAHASVLPCSMAWEAFGESNGARSLPQMKAQIARYRKLDPADRSDFRIGCRILTQPFFFEEKDWIPVPASWASNIVSIKKYKTAERDGRRLWEAVTSKLEMERVAGHGMPEERFGEPQLIHPRLGQGAFRSVVTDLYNWRCAVTKERTLPALEAAHIRPYSDGGSHEPRNGLLLRSDIHRLFDQGYVTVTPDLHFEVSPRIKEEFENGKDYYACHGSRISTPRLIANRPDPDELAWHNETCFRP